MSGAIIDGLLRRIADTEKERDEAYAERDLHIRAAGLLEQEIEKTREAALWEAWNVVWEAKTLLDAKNALHALIGEART